MPTVPGGRRGEQIRQVIGNPARTSAGVRPGPAAEAAPGAPDGLIRAGLEPQLAQDRAVAAQGDPKHRVEHRGGRRVRGHHGAEGQHRPVDVAPVVRAAQARVQLGREPRRALGPVGLGPVQMERGRIGLEPLHRGEHLGRRRGAGGRRQPAQRLHASQVADHLGASERAQRHRHAASPAGSLALPPRRDVPADQHGAQPARCPPAPDRSPRPSSPGCGRCRTACPTPAGRRSCSGAGPSWWCTQWLSGRWMTYPSQTGVATFQW